MKVYFDIYVKNNKGEPSILDIDLDTLYFTSRGEEFNIDLVGSIDAGWNGNSIDGEIKLDGFTDLLHEGLTQDEVEVAFKEAENVKFNCGIYDDAETEFELDRWEIEVVMGDTIRQFHGEF